MQAATSHAPYQQVGTKDGIPPQVTESTPVALGGLLEKIFDATDQNPSSAKAFASRAHSRFSIPDDTEP